MNVNFPYAINCKTNIKVFYQREMKKSITVIKINVKNGLFTVVKIKVKLLRNFFNTYFERLKFFVIYN